MTVVIVGSGLVGLSAAAALEERGIPVTLIAHRRAGEASPAAAGMLAPGVEAAQGPAYDFGVAARERYPSFIDWVERATGVAVALDRSGIIQLPASPEDAKRLRAEGSAESRWIDAAELRAMEPALSPAEGGALFHANDGWVDNASLVAALRTWALRAAGVTLVDDPAVAIEPGHELATVRCASGRHHTGSTVVIAGGAWVSELPGLPRRLPIEPVRGQMLAVGATPFRHVVFGGGGYAVPRQSAETLIGSTMERVGFDAATTPAALKQLQTVAATLSPALGSAPTLRHWSGLRPVTPDLHPIVGRDPDASAVIYACGHSRNGILMAPLTGDVVAALACREQPWYDLSPYSPTRFPGALS